MARRLFWIMERVATVSLLSIPWATCILNRNESRLVAWSDSVIVTTFKNFDYAILCQDDDIWFVYLTEDKSRQYTSTQPQSTFIYENRMQSGRMALKANFPQMICLSFPETSWNLYLPLLLPCSWWAAVDGTVDIKICSVPFTSQQSPMQGPTQNPFESIFVWI